jgi:uncharacterized membrane protein
MIFILGCAAIAIDVGSWYQTQRQAQAAADAAALAGVQDLPGNPSGAITDAQAYVGKNIANASTSATTPASDQVHVSVSVPGALWFGGIFGIGRPTITASATAQRNPNVVPYALFSYDSNCSNQSMTINGNNISVDGGTHSNGSFFQNANNASYDAMSYGGPNGCSLTDNGNNTKPFGASGAVRDNRLEPWPVDYSAMSIPCTYTGSSFTFSGTGTTIPAGVYCASGQITINGNNLSGNVTFIASSFNLNANHPTFTPYAKGLIIYQTGTSALDINGNGFINNGAVFAPQASIVVNGNSGSANSFIEGLDVTITGNSLTINGVGPPFSGSIGSLTS